MTFLRRRWWDRRAHDLSAYADGELPAAAAERVAVRLALDPEARRQLARLRGVDRAVEAALTPHPPIRDTAEVADTILAAAVPAPPGAASAYGRWVALASVGLLLTAGLVVAGCRRRIRF